MQAAYIGEEQVRQLVESLRQRSHPLLIPAPRTDGEQGTTAIAGSNGARFGAQRLKGHLRRVK
jgi:hypothetical protein